MRRGRQPEVSCFPLKLVFTQPYLGRVLLGSTGFSWLGFLLFYSVGFVDQLFQPPSNWMETVEKALAATAVVYAGNLKSAAGSCRVAFPQLVNAEKSGNNDSQELPRWNRKRLEKCSIGKPQPLQRKLVAVQTVDPNRTRPHIAKYLFSIRDDKTLV